MTTTYDPYNPKRAPKVPEPETPSWRERQAMRRRLAQDFGRLEKTCASLIEARAGARVRQNLDDVQSLSEAIYCVRKAITHIRHIARANFDKSLEELGGYE